MVNLKPIDSVRASREGHEFHEAWTARKALQLLLPLAGLPPDPSSQRRPPILGISDLPSALTFNSIH